MSLQDNNLNANRRTFIAGAAITKGEPLELATAANTVQPINAATDIVIGFAGDSVASGANVPVILFGPTITSVSAGSVTKNSWVGLSGTAGKIGSLTLDGSGTTVQQVLGVALNAGASDGDEVEVAIGQTIYQV